MQTTGKRVSKSPSGRDGNGGERRRNNRDRILAASLELFNERGTVSVSTKTIAAELGISPGNLYYHFKNKEQIIRELWCQFDHIIMEKMHVPEDGSVLPPTALADFFITAAPWDIRCFTRDIDEIVSNDPEFAALYRSEMDWGRDQIVAMFRSLIDHGAMSAPADRRNLERLATSIQLHLQNWMRFLSTARGIDVGPVEIADGGLHAFFILEPYLDGEYAQQVRAAIERNVRAAKTQKRR